MKKPRIFFASVVATVLAVSTFVARAADEIKMELKTNQVDGVRLSPQDLVFFLIKEDPAAQPGSRLAVNALGEADFPISADPATRTSITLQVNGKTLAEVKAELKKKLEADYYVKATIVLEVNEKGKKPGEAMIFGDGIGRTITVPLPPDEKVTLFNAVMKASPNEFAKLSKVELMREDKATRKSVSTFYDIDKMKKTGDLSKDIELKDGDKIKITDSWFFFR